ncbi:MAG TPA: hypothetical protein VFN35_15115, partial [Ktedonobacteraceae bacterium]|nr:hypothetical protein [Ktedonobacteraceae bacterium]
NATPAASSNVLVKTAQIRVNGTTRTVLTNANGHTLYFTEPGLAEVAICRADCLKNWPLLAPTGSAVPTGDKGVTGKLSVKDGGNGAQVQYNGNYLYTYAGDTKPGDANGAELSAEDLLWHVVTPDVQQAEHEDLLIKTAQVSVNGTVKTVLTDSVGRTLYYFTPDTADVAACQDDCAYNWPIVNMGSNGEISGDAGVTGKLTLKDGGNGDQIQYNGHFLYSFSGDKHLGEANGEGLGQDGKIWHVATPDLQQI